jgi:hypothetical protein
LFGGVGETIALVVGIAALTGVVIGGAWGLVSSSNSSAEWQAVSQTAQSLLTAYQGESLPSGSLVATAVQDHLIGNAATGTQSGDPVILNPYGGTRSFTGNGLNTLTVVDSELPPDACTNFLKSIPATGWLSAAVGSTTFTTFPISRAAADTACGAGTGTTVSITLTIAQS